MSSKSSKEHKKKKRIRMLTQEVQKWKTRAKTAAVRACIECECLGVNCDKCCIKKIREESEE